MRISEISVKNFRLLKDVQLGLDSLTTVIVGRNNSGKTSLTELFHRILTETTPQFPLEDFSLSSHEEFWNAFVMFTEGKEDGEIREILPCIEVQITFDYEMELGDLGPLSEFIVDLNPDLSEAATQIRYQLDAGKLESLFGGFEPALVVTHPTAKTELFKALRERVPRLYRCSLTAVDPGDPSNSRNLDWSKLKGLLQGDFINAQRRLDDASNRDAIGKILESLFSTARSEYSTINDRDAAKMLTAAVDKMQENVDGNIDTNLKVLLPTMSLFGYPGLSDPGLSTETKLDVSTLLANHTRVRYAGANGISLPESQNGLGTRNLIYILLKLLQFFKSFQAMQTAVGLQLIFIEEPEAHLHPQMQEVFIRKLGDIAAIFARDYNEGVPWPVQFIVSTHSPHMANEASFDATRYFVASPDADSSTTFQTRVKDLSKGLGGMNSDDKEFLHKYMTLTRCDLLFADKAVLIEGTSERLLLPKMIKMVGSAGDISRPLSSQYVTAIEVGGAYAHKFFALLEFLELKTLIITDLDAVKGNNGMSCMVSQGDKTSNACIRKWFENPTISPTDLLLKSQEEKTRNLLRIAFQVPESSGEVCGRSFEGAFMLANGDLFDLEEIAPADMELKVWSLAEKIHKTEFALEYAINIPDWKVPRYIEEGLIWLSSDLTFLGSEIAQSAVAPESAYLESSIQ